MDYSVLKGQRVRHKTIGDGFIEDTDGKYIYVRFPSRDQPVRFSAPICFRDYLTLYDTNAVELVKKEIAIAESIEAERLAKVTEAAKIREAKLNSTSSGVVIKREITNPLPKIDSVDTFRNIYDSALQNEIAAARKNGGKEQSVYDGKRIRKDGKKYLYSFSSETELHYPDDTEISIKSPRVCKGTIVCCDDYSVTISSDCDLGANISRIIFTSETWRLLERLRDHLFEMKAERGSITNDLICNGSKYIQRNRLITQGQDNALKMALIQPITFIWGPPGTGKTETLATISLEFIKQGMKVLMLSYSNVSVDGAINRVFAKDTDHRPGKIIRYGYPHDKGLLDHEYLTAYSYTLLSHPALNKERLELIAEKKSLNKASERTLSINRRLAQIREYLKEEEQESVHKADFVATTVSKAIVDKTLYDHTFDVVIFDEASMAYVPQVIFAASLARSHFICLGDFSQLPPIVETEDSSILNVDIFRYSGIFKAVQEFSSHKWLCLLDTQYRMHPVIADYASKSMYRLLLKSDASMLTKRTALADNAPLRGAALGLADFSGMMSVCSDAGDSSRLNPLSAMIVIGLAISSAKTSNVGIITPYHAQSRLYQAMARDLSERAPDLMPITSATVHSFQGSEQDVIYYDAVDCYRQRYPGVLLSRTEYDYANRLFNVALTRAKGKFIACANMDYMEKKLSSQLMFRELIRELRNVQCLQGSDFGNETANLSKYGYKWLGVKEGNTQFLNDIRSAQREIRIDVPGEVRNDKTFLSNLAHELYYAEQRGVNVYIRTEKINTISSYLRPYAHERWSATQAIALIDRKTVWFGEPISMANFIIEKNEVETKYRPIIRFEGTYTARCLYGLLQMDKVFY